ncbi:MAG: hypothetical protein J0651_03325, partial [Actinobacteria bacterium]|nr:hypothetical protein [Actinomycetota bacterium]
MQLSNSLVELYHQQEKWDDVWEQADWTLHTFEDTEHLFELQRALYFHTSSCHMADERAKGLAVAEKWIGMLAESRTACQWLLLLNKAEVVLISCKWREAMRLYEQALELAKCPAYSYLLADAKCNLGIYYSWQLRNASAKAIYAETFQTYITHFPRSRAAFSFFESLEYWIAPTAKKSKYQELEQLYSARFPQSCVYVCCLSKLLHICEYEKNWGDAFQLYEEAEAVFSAYYSQTLQYAEFLLTWGEMYREKEKNKPRYLQACHIALASLPQCDVLISCLRNVQEDETAEELYLKAYQVYMTSFPHARRFPEFLRACGDFYCYKKQYAKAEEKYMQAYHICCERFPQSRIYGEILLSLATLCKLTERSEDIINYYLQAYHTIAEFDSQFRADLLKSIAQCFCEREQPGSWEQWEQALATDDPNSWFYADCLYAQAD